MNRTDLQELKSALLLMMVPPPMLSLRLIIALGPLKNTFDEMFVSAVFACTCTGVCAGKI
jgi:hypothetical protein